MISWIIALGIPERFAKPVLIALGIVLLIAALAVGKCSYDRALIAGHDATTDATIATDGRAGEANAAAERRADDAAISNQSDEVSNATQAIPDRPTSARQHARACVLLHQQARASGVPASAGC